MRETSLKGREEETKQTQGRMKGAKRTEAKGIGVKKGIRREGYKGKRE